MVDDLKIIKKLDEIQNVVAELPGYMGDTSQIENKLDRIISLLEKIAKK